MLPLEIKKWTFEVENDDASEPVVADGKVYVGSNGPMFSVMHIYHKVYALDAITGTELWNYTIEGNAGHIIVADGVVYVGSSQASTENNEENGYVYALKPTENASPPPSKPNSDLQWIAIVAVVVIVILAISFIGYRIRRKGG
jgi:outer membrane protein assembly factor BamB